MAIVAIVLVNLSTGPPTESATQVVMVGWTDTATQKGVTDIWDRALVSLLDQPTTLHQVIDQLQTVCKFQVASSDNGARKVRYHLLCFHSPLGECTLIG